MSTAIDTTRGPLLSALVRLATPVVVMQACHTAFHLVNVMWVGRLGAAATAAVTTSFFMLWTLWSFADIAGVGTTASVSRHVGAGARDEAAHAASQGALLALLIGVVVSVVGVAAIGPIYASVGTAPDVARLATGYLRILLGGAIVATLYVWAECTMRAAGDTRTPLVVIASSIALNAVLDPLLIFGLGPFPRLGIEGAAIATVIAQAFAVAWFLGLALRNHPAFPLDRKALGRFEPRFALGLARIGVPYSLIGILFSVVYVYFAHVAARFGTAAVASVGVSNRIESVTYLVAAGFSLACEAIVGQNLGARKSERAERVTLLSCALMGSFGIVVSIAMLAWPRVLIGIFSSDPLVIEAGVPYLRLLAISQAFTGVELVLNGAFSGAGDTVPPMVISTSMSLLRIPLAWMFAVTWGMGLPGLALMITITCAVRTLILAWWFRRGAWKSKALPTSEAPPLTSPLS